VHGVRFLAEADGLRHDRGDDALRRALDQLPDERATDAVADHHEAPDAQVIHKGEVIVGVGVHGRSISSGPEDWPLGTLRRSAVIQRYSSLNSSVALNGARCEMKPMVEFWPPPGMTNSGKPEPASW